VALAKARALAARAGVDVSFVEADATALPADLASRFDLAYASIGVLSWIDDLGAWMRSAAGTLRPGGRLVLVEVHPLLNMFESSDPPRLDFPYQGAEPRSFDDGSYAVPDAKLSATKNVVYAHDLGETVTAAVEAGLIVERLTEHLDADFDPRATVLKCADDGRYRLLLDGLPLPVLFTLIARRPER
jgi:SAM-dependent methyltransferase